MANLTPPTQENYTDVYKALIVYNSSDNDVSEFTDFDTKGKVLGGTVAGASQDAYKLYQNNYPQYADEQGINLKLAAAGVSGIFAASQAIILLTANNVESGETYNIPIGTILTAPNNLTYKVIGTINSNEDYVVITESNEDFYVASVNTGSNTGQVDATELTFSPPIVSVSGNFTLTAAVVATGGSTDGADQESLASATNRLIEISQAPLCGTRSTDFKNLVAPDTANSVTDAQTLNANELTYTNNVWNLGVYIISGDPINDTILNQGLLSGTTAQVFSRTSSNDSVENSQDILDDEDVVGVRPICETVATQQITSLIGGISFFKIIVTLKPGFSLTDNITLDAGNFTLKQLIQREVRRAICAQPYGATLTYGEDLSITASSIPISAIEQQLDTALGTPTTTGTVGSYLLDRSVLCWSGSEYVYQATITLDTGLPVADADQLQWIYDISTTAANIYSNIDVVLSS